MATSKWIWPEANRWGTSDRNTGTKSARPSATAWRSGGPVNRDTARKAASIPGAT